MAAKDKENYRNKNLPILNAQRPCWAGKIIRGYLYE
jgi:hypothetical protein